MKPRLLLLAALLSLLAAPAQGQTCANASIGFDYGTTVRVPQYPSGLGAANWSVCCSVCSGLGEVCAGWVFMIAESRCYPVASYSGLVANPDRVTGSEPVAPVPPEWRPKIAAFDMLYAPSDASIPENLMPMIGNGFLATQLTSSALYCAGIFNGEGLETGSHRARIPATFAVPAPGVPGPAALDVREATYFRRSFVPFNASCGAGGPPSFSCTSVPGGVVVEQRFYAHRALPSVAVMEVQLLGSPPVGSVTLLGLVNNAGPPTTDFNFSAAADLAPDAPYGAVVGSTLGTECPPGACGPDVVTHLFGVAVLTTTLPADGFLAVPPASPNATAYFLTVVRTSIETHPPTPAALVAAAQADFANATALAAAGQLRASHIDEWANTLWTSGFSTDRGDVALAVNTSLYAILSSLRPDRPFSTSPGGLANDGYNGHSFWDQDLWMSPGLNLLYPPIAQSLMEYRFNLLPGAYYKATTFDPPYSGAVFPWESAVSGTELASAPWGTRELHISSDIAWEINNFWSSTQDETSGWLSSIGYPLLAAIAEGWMSKLALDNPSAGPSDPLYLLDVMGPDEYHDHVNNSAYTNAGVIQALTYAAAAAATLDVNASAAATWLDAGSRIYIPFDPARQYHPEFDGYVLNTTVKQADTIMLGFPLLFSHATVTAATLANDLAAYGPVTDEGGPAMTWGMFAVGYIQLGAAYATLAASNFNRSFANAQPPFYVWLETPSGGTPNFLTGAGGFLQTAFSGYPGLRMNASGAFFLSPALPEHTSTVGIRSIAFLGSRFSVNYNATSIAVVAESDAAGRLTRAPIEAHHAAANRTFNDPFGLTERAQWGRVILADGHVVVPRPLILVDAAGAKYPLVPGGDAVVIELQSFSVQAGG